MNLDDGGLRQANFLSSTLFVPEQLVLSAPWRCSLSPHLFCASTLGQLGNGQWDERSCKCRPTFQVGRRAASIKKRWLLLMDCICNFCVITIEETRNKRKKKREKKEMEKWRQIADVLQSGRRTAFVGLFCWPCSWSEFELFKGGWIEGKKLVLFLVESRSGVSQERQEMQCFLPQFPLKLVLKATRSAVHSQQWEQRCTTCTLARPLIQWLECV